MALRVQLRNVLPEQFLAAGVVSPGVRAVVSPGPLSVGGARELLCTVRRLENSQPPLCGLHGQ